MCFTVLHSLDFVLEPQNSGITAALATETEGDSKPPSLLPFLTLSVSALAITSAACLLGAAGEASTLSLTAPIESARPFVEGPTPFDVSSGMALNVAEVARGDV